MTVVVVHKSQGVICVFAGETEGIVKSEVVVRRSRATGSDSERAEGSVLVVRCDITILRDDFAYILVAVVGVEDGRCIVVPCERASSDGLYRIPNEQL